MGRVEANSVAVKNICFTYSEWIMCIGLIHNITQCGCHRPWTPCWIPQPVSCHSPEAASTISKCSWRWTKKLSETCRAILQLQTNILPSCMTLVLLYILTYDAPKPKHKIQTVEIHAYIVLNCMNARTIFRLPLVLLDLNI